MGRVDYWRDPDAPKPNSLVVAASAVVTDDHGRIALHRRVDNGLWALPGGRTELGESIRDTVVREVLEETGLTVEAEYVVAIYSDPEHVFAYDNGEVRQEFSVCIKCKVSGGTLSASDESHEVCWFAPDEIAGLSMHPRIRVRVKDYLDGKKAVLDP
jgi:8-oxo-dGTP pyrophosphatase MutT (NUDIX family)